MFRSLSFRCASSVRVMVAASLLALAGVAEAQAVSGHALPLVFEQNEGQLAAGTAFAGSAPGYRLELRADELRFAMQGTRTITVGFAGSKGGKPEGIAEAGFRTNYYVGSDPKQWRTGVRNFDRVGLRGVYPGIDAEFYARDGAIEHDFIVAPGADASLVTMKIAGAERMSVTAGGDVELAAEDGELRLRKPVAYQVMADGSRKSVDARFELKARGDLRFVLGAYDRARELVIDPVITYASFAAGGSGSTAGSVASDTAGNVYLSGTTSSGKFGSQSPIVNCGSGSCPNNIFVLKFASGSSGAAPSWLTYIGEPGTGSMVVTSSVVGTATLFVGGYTNATALASAGSAAVSNPTGGYVGFVSGLSESAGTLSGTNLIYADAANPNNDSVEGLALDKTGNLYVTGAIGFTTTSSPVLKPTANAFLVSPAVTVYSLVPGAYPGNAYVAEYPVLSPLSSTPLFFTYVQQNTLATAVAVDANGLIYVAGQTSGNFTEPKTGTVFSNTSLGYDSFEFTFTPVAIPAPPAFATAPTIGAFTWINGNGSTTVAGLGTDGAGNSYLFGNTLASNLATALGTTNCAVQCTMPDASGSGYAVELGSTGAAVGYTYLGGSSTTDTVTGGAFVAGAAYVSGQTNSPKSGGTAFAGTVTTQTATSPFNTKALAFGEDATTTLVKRGYVVSMAAGLGLVNYVANVGGSGGSDTAVGVAVDASGDAYVAANIGYGSGPYTPAGAFEAASPATSGSSAYLVEISTSTVLTGLTLTAATGSPSNDPLGYVSPTNFSTVTYTWNLGATANVTTSDIVVGIAVQANLTYTSAQLTDTTSGGTTVGSCTLGTAGVSCLVPTWPQTVAGTNDALKIVLNASMNSTAYSVPGTISITATAASEASEYVSSTQISDLAKPSNLAITLGTLSVTGVYAASAGTGYTGILVTYPIKLTNQAGGSEAKTASLSFSGAFPTGFTPTTVTPTITGGGTIGSCDTTTAATGCTSVDLPVNAVLTYSITGYYSDAAVFAAGSTAPSATSGSFSVAASGVTNTVNATLATGTTITRAVDISVGVNKSSLVTYDGLNPATKLATFNLSTTATPAPINYTYTLVNAGPSIAYNVPLTATFPMVPGSGFVVTGATGTDSAGNAVTCTYAPSLSCLVGEIAAGTPAVVILTATYPDQAPLADAVTAPAKSASYSLAGTAVAPSATYKAYATGSLTATFPSTAVTIERTAALTVTITKTTSVAPVCGTGGTTNPCVYMYNASTNLNANANQYDTALYNITVTNAGPDAATAAELTLTLPTAPTTTGTTPTTHPLGSVVATATASSVPTGWSGDVISTCTVGTTVTCGSTTTSGAIGIPALTSVAVTLSGTFDSATVPVTAESVTTAAIPGTAAVTASVFAGVPTKATNLQTYSVVRSSHLVIRKSRNAVVDVPPVTYADQTDPDLDEKTTGTTFGFDDEIEYEVAIGNGGVNDAPGVTVTDTLPPYFTVYKTFLIGSTSLTPDSVANGTPAGTSLGTATCSAGATVMGTAITLPYATGATTQQITCKAPAGYSLPADNSTTGTPGTSGVELVYQGKFQNNFPAADDIPNGLLLYAVTSNAGDATDTTALATDYQAATDEMSAAVPQYNVQRIPIMPTIVVTPIPNHTYGDTPFTVSATSPSTVAITFSIASGNATVTGSTVTITGTGTVCVAASQVAGGSYAAGSAQACFTVAQEAQTISVLSVVSPVTYGIPPITLPGTASSGLPVSYTYLSGPGSVSAGVLTVTGVGTITINANQAGNADFLAAAQVQFQVVVMKASPVISWTTPAAIGYGTALSATQLDAVVTGVGGSTLAGSSVYTPAAGAILGVGTQTLSVTFTPANVADYTTATGIVTLVVGRGTPAMTLTASANPVFVQDAVTFTATLTSPGTTPIGTVDFVDGTTIVGSGTISSGVASFTTSALAAGSHSITAVYTGDANYGAITSAAVVEVVDDFSLTVGGSSASQTVALSGAATYTLAVTPVGSTTLPGAVNFTVSGLPAGASVSFAPAIVAAGAGATNVTLTIVAPAKLAMLERRPGPDYDSRKGLASIGGFAGLALLLLPFSRRLRKRAGKLSRAVSLGLLLLAGAATAIGISGCGTGSPTQSSETFTLTVNGTSGTLIHTAIVTLTVQ